jgi:REP element-mobilizing transposase RayT
MIATHRNRKAIRLKEYDYSRPGEYFVTICTYEKEYIFGEIIADEMHLSQEGIIAQQCWKQIPNHFEYAELDEYVVMPNHIHGIIILNYHGRDVQLNVPTRLSPKKGSLSVIIRTYKAAVTTECRRKGLFHFRWQSRFYEHIIRSDKDLNNIREYITGNILKWAFDSEYIR